jgi:hypothetical protein
VSKHIWGQIKKNKHPYIHSRSKKKQDKSSRNLHFDVYLRISIMWNCYDFVGWFTPVYSRNYLIMLQNINRNKPMNCILIRPWYRKNVYLPLTEHEVSPTCLWRIYRYVLHGCLDKRQSLKEKKIFPVKFKIKLLDRFKCKIILTIKKTEYHVCLAESES